MRFFDRSDLLKDRLRLKNLDLVRVLLLFLLNHRGRNQFGLIFSAEMTFGRTETLIFILLLSLFRRLREYQTSISPVRGHRRVVSPALRDVDVVRRAQIPEGQVHVGAPIQAHRECGGRVGDGAHSLCDAARGVRRSGS